MFYKLIEKKRNEWLASDECTIKYLLRYMVQRGMMRDAQMEAIKTYLFLNNYEVHVFKEFPTHYYRIWHKICFIQTKVLPLHLQRSSWQAKRP
jgi:hypothetical protein